MSTMSYNCGARAYLKRAKEQLDTGTKEALFYAAFELRSGIEGRLQEYLEAHEDVSKRKKAGWKIVRLARDLERAIPLGGKILEFSVTDTSGNTIQLYFTPISTKLKELGCRAGEYLHCMKKGRPDNDTWWAQTRELLTTTYDELLLATAGTMLCPPMTKPNSKSVTLNVELGIIPEHDSFLRDRQVGTEWRTEIKILPVLPPAYLSLYKSTVGT